MRYFIIFFIFSGCLSNSPRYEPVDWNSQALTIPDNQSSNIDEVPETLQNLLKLHNEQRELKGRPGFQLDPHLCKYAQNHSDWMAENNKLKHSDIRKLIGKYTAVGENIAWNQQSEADVVYAWMHSTGHKANIMNRKFTKVGFGVSYNKNGEPYWCTCFGG